jgi:hypothetical protein
VFASFILASGAGNIIPQSDGIYKALAKMASLNIIKSEKPAYFEVNAMTNREAASYIYEAGGNTFEAKLSADQSKQFSAWMKEYTKRFATELAAIAAGTEKDAALPAPGESSIEKAAAEVENLKKDLPAYVMGDGSPLKVTGIINFKYQNLFAEGITNFHNDALSGSLLQFTMERDFGDAKIGAAFDLEMKKNDPAAGTSNTSFYGTAGLLDSYDLYATLYGFNITGGMFWEDLTPFTASQGPSDRPSLFDRDKYAAESTSRDYYETMFRNYFQSLDYRWSMHPWMGLSVKNDKLFAWGDSVEVEAGKVERFYADPSYLYEFGAQYTHRQDLVFLYNAEWSVTFYNASNEKTEMMSLGKTESDAYNSMKSVNVAGGGLKTNIFRLFKTDIEFDSSHTSAKYGAYPYTLSGNVINVMTFPTFLPKQVTLELKYTMIDAGYKAPASGVIDTNYIAMDPANPAKVKVQSISYASDPTTLYNNMNKVEASARFAIPFGLLRVNYGVSSQPQATGNMFYSRHYILGNDIYSQGFFSNYGYVDTTTSQYSAIINYDRNRFGYTGNGIGDYTYDYYSRSAILSSGKGGLYADNNGNAEYMVSNAVTGETNKSLASAVFDLRFELSRLINFKRDLLLHVYGELNNLSADFNPVVSYDPDRMFSQNIITSTLVYNVINSVNLLGYWGMERWASRSVEPYGLDYLENMYGVGADWDVGPRTGLYLRVKNYFHKDMQVPANNFHGWMFYLELKSFF